jgi:hypothetical protein
MSRRLLATLQAALGLALLLATVTPFSEEVYAQGNSAAAARCHQLGYQHLVRADLTPFKNTGDCVHYGNTTGTPPLIVAHLVQLPSTGPFWTGLEFAGSGFLGGSRIIVTAVSIPPGFGPIGPNQPISANPDGTFPLHGPVWPNTCFFYYGTVRLTATDTQGTVAWVDFQSPC